MTIEIRKDDANDIIGKERTHRTADRASGETHRSQGIGRDRPSGTATDKPLEMLTVKECAALVDGLSEHTVRQLVKQDKVAYIRTGAGRNGKILVSKASLLKYLGVAN